MKQSPMDIFLEDVLKTPLPPGLEHVVGEPEEHKRQLVLAMAKTLSVDTGLPATLQICRMLLEKLDNLEASVRKFYALK